MDAPLEFALCCGEIKIPLNMTMLKVRFRKFVVLMLLLAFTSQIMAATAVNCTHEKTNARNLTAGEMAIDKELIDTRLNGKKINEIGLKDIGLTHTNDIHKDTPDINIIDHNDTNMGHMHHPMNNAHQPINDSNHPGNNTDQLHDTHQNPDCCKTMGHCLLGGCSLATASHSLIFFLHKIDSRIEDFHINVLPTPLISSRYRPPIFC